MSWWRFPAGPETARPPCLGFPTSGRIEPRRRRKGSRPRGEARSRPSRRGRFAWRGAGSPGGFPGDQRDALHAVGAAGVECSLGDEVVVVWPQFPDREPGLLDGLRVGPARDRSRDAGCPELRIAPGLLLERLGAVDVRDGQAPACAKHPGRLEEDPALDGRQVDYAIGDHHVEALLFERDLVDRRLQELDPGEPCLIAESGRLADLLGGEIESDDDAVLSYLLC